MSNNNLFAFYDQPGRDNPYGKLYPNSSMQTPTHLENGNTNT